MAEGGVGSVILVYLESGGLSSNRTYNDSLV